MAVLVHQTQIPLVHSHPATTSKAALLHHFTTSPLTTILDLLISPLFHLHMRIRRRPQLQPCPATLPSSSSTTTTLPYSQPRQAPPRGGGDKEDEKKIRSCVEGKGDADGTEGKEFVSLRQQRHYDDVAVAEIQNGCTPLTDPSSHHLHKKPILMMAAGPNHDDGITNIKVLTD